MNSQAIFVGARDSGGKVSAHSSVSAVPIVDVTLQRGSTTNYFVFTVCPFCGRSQIHGAGRPGQDARDHMGQRYSHCAAGGHYELRWNGNEMPQ